MSTRKETRAPVEALGLVHSEAEITVLCAMRQDMELAVHLAETLRSEEFYDTRHRLVFEAICNILLGIEPIDTPAIVAESRRLIGVYGAKVQIDAAYIEGLVAGDIRRATLYANTVKKLAWLRQAGDFAFWMAAELQTRPNPDDMFAAAQERWQQLQPAQADSRFVYGWDTKPSHMRLIQQRIKDAQEGIVSGYTWPWASWNRKDRVRPLLPGDMGILAAADGLGKTTFLESISEHWARIGYQVVSVHLEDEIDYKKDRRLARHSLVPMDAIEDGKLTEAQYRQVKEAYERMDDWLGRLHYYHAAGETMISIIRNLETRVAEGVCQAVVFDYLDKVQMTRGQVKAFGDNIWERQAADMEMLKNFAQRAKIPVFTATQGNKAMQGVGIQTRANIQGSGQKSQKAQLVVLLTREIAENGLHDASGRVLAKPGEYSPIVKVRIDKQNRGTTCSFQQFLLGQFFTVRDIENDKESA